MNRRFQLLYLLILIPVIGKAQNPNYSENIAGILYKNCLACHRTGGIGENYLKVENYSQVYPMRNSIANATGKRRMPPWPADPMYRRFAHERVLSDQEIALIKQWADNGGPEGDPALKPALPPPASEEIPNPDQRVSTLKYTVPSGVSSDYYRNFVIGSGVNIAKFIREFEFVPGNRQIVHHVLIFYDTTGVCRSLDNADPNPGYDGFGGVGTGAAQLISAWVPGAGKVSYPAGFGVYLPKNADLVMQFHFAPGSNGKSDSSHFNMNIYPSNNGIRPLGLTPALNHSTSLLNGPLLIPANSVKTFYSSFTLPIDVTLLGIAPHMHLIGSSIKVFAVGPTKDTIRLINIPKWDFHWQGLFQYRQLMKVPKLYKLQAIATYDNTVNNPFNPSNPPVNVSLGEGTKDEMMLVYFNYTPYLSGDENIIADTATPKQVGMQIIRGKPHVKVYPNPSSDGRFLLETEKTGGEWSVYNASGQCILQPKTAEWFREAVDLSGFPAGIYLLRYSGTEGEAVFRLMKNE